MSATNDWQQLAGVRFALGVVEAGFAPGIAFYLSSWYAVVAEGRKRHGWRLMFSPHQVSAI